MTLSGLNLQLNYLPVMVQALVDHGCIFRENATILKVICEQKIQPILLVPLLSLLLEVNKAKT